MIGYVTLGTNNIEQAAHFYDELLALQGAKRAMQNDRLIAWGNAPGAPIVCVIKPFNGNAATPGNGNMTSLFVADTAQVDKLHAKALALGAQDEGAPGPRGDGFYGAYFRDLDGNKLCVFNM